MDIPQLNLAARNSVRKQPRTPYYESIVFCLVPRCNSTFGDRSFAVAGPRLWNSLPTAIRNISLTIHTFDKHLKTHLFSGWARPRRICDIYDFFAPYTNVLTYLLTYLCGRPFGGVMILIDNKLRKVTETIVCDERFAIVRISNVIVG